MVTCGSSLIIRDIDYPQPIKNLPYVGYLLKRPNRTPKFSHRSWKSITVAFTTLHGLAPTNLSSPISMGSASVLHPSYALSGHWAFAYAGSSAWDILLS